MMMVTIAQTKMDFRVKMVSAERAKVRIRTSTRTTKMMLMMRMTQMSSTSIMMTIVTKKRKI